MLISILMKKLSEIHQKNFYSQIYDGNRPASTLLSSSNWVACSYFGRHFMKLFQRLKISL
jgi:hypothetical protein